jgi:membrane protease subunit HflK
VDSKQGSNLLYLPLDKIMQQVSSVAPPALDNTAATVPANGNAANNGAVDTRSRDLQRSRERDPR